MKVLITGAAGFIGHHVVEHILKNTDWEIISLDRLSVSGTLLRLTDLECWEAQKHRFKTVAHDLRSAVNEVVAAAIGDVDYIVHMAASTHVDRSIEDPMGFVLDNVVATTNILQFARTQKNLKHFFYFSTDEVFGPAPDGVAYKEWDRYNSGNPYAAAKAGGEEMALAFANTFNIPMSVTHTMNVFGERQHPEKYIPKVITAILTGKKIFIHANKDRTKAGSRFWIHARNVADALLFVIGKRTGEQKADKFNIVGAVEVDNLTLAKLIFQYINHKYPNKYKLDFELVDFHSSRPGHDLRYALDGSKLAAMGWEPPKDFLASLGKTVDWYLQNQSWLKIA